MKILIDADACPVVDLTIKVAKEFGIEVLIFCDENHIIEKENIKTLYAPQGADSVDFFLLSKTLENDIVVTQDFGLASMILTKKAFCLNQNGLIYTNFNIESLLFSRHMSKKIRNNGGRTKGPKKREKSDDENFEVSLRNIISKGK